MLNWRNVSLIFRREVRDQLRDRRTLFMIAVLPLILYPAMGLGIYQLAFVFRQQPRTVVVLGAENLPGDPPLIDGDRFSSRWFPSGADPGRLVVITDGPESADRAADRAAAGDGAPEARQLLERAQKISKVLHGNRQAAGELFGTSGLQVLVVVPRGFGENLKRVREQLSRRREGGVVPTDYPRPEIVFNKADEKSQITYNRVATVLEKWEAAILDDWLKRADFDKGFTHPVLAEPVDVALDEQMAASAWSKLFPALLIIMSVTGAFYPAIDLVAGEKERGTMETLLICPATRTEIVLGKFFTVMLFSCTTAVLNLTSMGLTGKQIFNRMPTGALSGATGVSFPPVSALFWIVVLLLPLAALFSALCLALATFARSSKEGQYYLTPLLMVTLGLTMLCLSPGVELTPLYSVLPIVGAALLLKGLLLSTLHTGALYVYVGPVLVTSLGYSALALWWAIDQFKREDVLFREGERFELRLWIRHLLRDKEPVPSFSEAAFCFVVIMLLQFFAMRFFQERLSPADLAGGGSLIMKLVLVQQLALVASPALMMGVVLTTSVRNTFRIHRPEWKPLLAAGALPLAIHPLSVELLSRMKWFFGDLPPGIGEALKPMSDASQPLWFVLLTFAVAPAICEELVFRGFLLSGFGRGGRMALAVALSSIAFGIIHMIPEQVFNTALLGLVLGTLAIRGNSLVPCILFHFVNNALGVFHSRFGVAWYEKTAPTTFFAIEDGALRYRWPTLVVCLAVAVPLLMWLFRTLRREDHDAGATGHSEARRTGLARLTLPPAGDALVPNRK
ncbi:MAG: ABC transporter permease subunit/CPBP intramembrane protease [Deltaproteobacteria bacterium]